MRPGVRVIAAFVVPESGSGAARLPAEEIRGYAREHLAAYKVPRIVVPVATLPRTANGKLLRRELQLPA